MKPITIFTPTFNRSTLLNRCYESMRRQTNQNFVWMVIDDGSSDDTREKVLSWMNNDNAFELKYYYKANGGLHTAYNEAIAHIETPLCACIDSDDFMPDDAIEKILNFWDVNGSERYAGIVGLDSYLDGTIIGGRFPNLHSINFIGLMTGKYHIQDRDTTIVVRTELYKKYAPMKVFSGEKNFNPHYMHLQICQEYDFLLLNEVLRFVEYQSDGMSRSIIKQYRNSPNSFAEIRKLYLSFADTGFMFKFRHSVHFVSSCTLAGRPWAAIQESPCKGITALAVPMGWGLALYTIIRG